MNSSKVNLAKITGGIRFKNAKNNKLIYLMFTIFNVKKVKIDC
jgi:hypothetical protein